MKDKRGHLRPILAAILISLSAVINSPQKSDGQEPGAFHWISQVSDPKLWTSTNRVFAMELTPDDPIKVKPYVALKYKYIARIGIFESAELVIIGERETADDKTGDFFITYSMDAVTHAKALIDKGTYEWKLVSLAHFDSSPAPDVVFSSLTCTECEAGQILSSFFYDASTKRWRMRDWTPRERNPASRLGIATSRGLTIGRDVDPGGDEVAFDCIWAVQDFTSDGRDDVAMRCRSVSEHNKGRRTTETATLFYSLVDGRFQGGAVKTPGLEMKLKSELCAAKPNSALCR